MSAVLDHLESLYAHTDDPWHFATSAYEQVKFRATRAALSRDYYREALEIGCGNGALAQHLAPVCERYAGIDAVDRAVSAARIRVPQATFVQGVYPCALPVRHPDLIILSEVLYFLMPDEIAQLARDLIVQAAGAEVVCVTYLGDTAQTLQGRAALSVFRTAVSSDLTLVKVLETEGYRIDCGIIGATAL